MSILDITTPNLDLHCTLIIKCYIWFWSAAWSRIWLQLTRFTRSNYETPHRLQRISKLYTIYWYEDVIRKTIIEFFLNEFHLIQRIQWIVTKSNSSMATRGITHLATDTLPVLVIKSAFSLLPLGRYLLPVTTQNRYQSTGSSRKFFFTTTSRNVTIVRCRMSLVTILLLDLVMIR